MHFNLLHNLRVIRRYTHWSVMKRRIVLLLFTSPLLDTWNVYDIRRRFAEMACANSGWLFMLCIWNIFFIETEAREYCGRFHGKEYYCETGNCCGKFDCCTYYKYYEMWWFWLVWCVISILGCCCAYHRRRSYAHHAQIQNFIYPSMLRSVASSPSCEELVTEPKYKLPSYAEVEAMENFSPPPDGPGAPPAYHDLLVNGGPQNDVENSYLNQSLSDDNETATARNCPTATSVGTHLPKNNMTRETTAAT